MATFDEMIDFMLKQFKMTRADIETISVDNQEHPTAVVITFHDGSEATIDIDYSNVKSH